MKIPSLLKLLLGILPVCAISQAAQIDISGPAGSGEFGSHVCRLANGNFVVTDPLYDAPGPIKDVGAVYLYSGTTFKLISRLTGSQTDDKIGSFIWPLRNGNYVVASPNWANGTATKAGAATWCDGDIGINGVVSASNSLVGTHKDDQVSGFMGLGVAMFPSNMDSYAVVSTNWTNGSAANAGAVTWASAAAGISGPVSASNSLVGTSANDRVGSLVMDLKGGQCVVVSSSWSNGKGAITWCAKPGAVKGPVTSSNSLVGTQEWSNALTAMELTNGHYLVTQSNWNNGSIPSAGAVAWCNGTTGRTGTLNSAIAFVGSQPNQRVTVWPDDVFPNDNYVVTSSFLSDDTTNPYGSATFCNGSTGRTGTVTAENSLTSFHPSPGHPAVYPLENGNYVVQSGSWHKGTLANVGITTWCSGTSGRVGKVNASNSLIGSAVNDGLIMGVVALKNGHYVVNSPWWHQGGTLDVGAVTWCNGTKTTSATISSSNSLVGSHEQDMMSNHVEALNNGHYVVGCPYWDRSGTQDAGAATWCDGNVGRIGTISISNSLVGTSANDRVGVAGAHQISDDSNYVVESRYWDNGSVADVGAATWAPGTGGIKGEISPLNSLVGSNAGDQVGAGGGPGIFWGKDMKDYCVGSKFYKSGSMAGAGAVTWCDGAKGTSGTIRADISILGRVPGGGEKFTPTAWPPRDLLIIGQPAANLVSILRKTETAVAKIEVQQPVGSRLVKGKSRKSFGTAKIGKKGSSRTFTVRNIGSAKLSGLAISLKGSDVKDFTISKPGATSLAPGAKTTFKVTFNPTKKGSRKTTLRIKSNAVGGSPFDVQLTGLAVK